MFSSSASQVSAANYTKDIFSTDLYTGNGSTQTITNGIDLAGKGGLVWIKSRSLTENNCLFDTNRGVNNYIFSNLTNSNMNFGSFGVTAFNTNGFNVTGGSGYAVNTSAATYVSWTFRKQAKFFDVVTYTGDGAANRTLTHNLTVAPELIILRKVNSSGYWYTYYNFGVTSCNIAQIESNAAASTSDYTGNFSKMGGAPTSSSFFVTNPFFGETNSSGTTYVAYLFSSSSNISKFGSYTGTGATQTIDCSFTTGAKFVMVKRTDTTGDWYVWDAMRGMVSGTNPSLLLNSNAAEVNANSVYTTGVGFQIVSTAAGINASGGSYIFLAIA
jgi:hypothetical protein